MSKGMELLDYVTLPIDRSEDPFIFPLPIPGNPAFLKQFNTIIEWREFIISHDLHPAIPNDIIAKFQRLRSSISLHGSITM